MDGARARRRELACIPSAGRLAPVAGRGVWLDQQQRAARGDGDGDGSLPLCMHFCFALRHETQATGFRIGASGSSGH